MRPRAVLSRGRHRTPAQGLCLMELTALLSGTAHTDRPVTAHPVLAAIARVTNDASSDAARAQLLPLAARLLDTRTQDPAVALTLVAISCETALAATPLPLWAPRLRRGLRQAQRRLSSLRTGTTVTTLTAREIRRAERTATLAAASLAFAPTADRDAVLRDLLLECLHAVDATPAASPHPTARCRRTPSAG